MDVAIYSPVHNSLSFRSALENGREYETVVIRYKFFKGVGEGGGGV